jgi:hypothetical protein
MMGISSKTEAATYEKLNKTPAVTRSLDCILEITEIIRPGEDIVSLFKKLRIGEGEQSIPAVGKIKLKSAIIEDDWVHPEVPPVLKQDEEVVLYFDDDLLGFLTTGMKMACELCELDVGVRFLKRLDVILPSFYTFLPQSMMRRYKPQAEDLRPAPSIHAPDGNEVVEDAED